MNPLSKISLAILLFVISISSAYATPAYNLTIINTYDFGSVSSGPSINDLGQIAYGSAIRDINGNLTFLSPLGSPDPGPGYVTVNAINNLGQVVGASSTGGWYLEATLWNNGTPTSLDQGVWRGSGAADINNSGQIVGFGENLGNGGPIFVNTNIGDFTSYGQAAAYAINDLGNAVGVGIPNQNIPAAQAVIWTSAGMTSLDARITTDDSGNIVDYGHSTAYDINNANTVVGEAEFESGYHATIWQNGLMIDLGVLEQNNYSSALALNEAGIIVGTAGVAAASRAVSFQDGQVVDLNTLIDTSVLQQGWLLTSATDVNESGWIVGNIFNQQLGLSQIFLLRPSTPIPEPPTWAILILGFIVIIFAAKHSNMV